MEIEIGGKLMFVLLAMIVIVGINIPHLINRTAQVLEKIAEIWKK